jgi:hypothetical protein
MSEPIEGLAVYLHLARASELRRRPHVRDRFLILAAAIAAEQGLARIAAYCRQCVLQHNPSHLIGRWPAVPSALRDPDFLHFLRHLERRYPREKAERMLDRLGINLGRERDVYYTDEEYAAALLGLSPDALDRFDGEDTA